MDQRNQWWKNGDHPYDATTTVRLVDGTEFASEGRVVRRFRDPDYPGGELCGECAQAFDVHGWLDDSTAVPHTINPGGEMVHPGDWIVAHGRDLYSVEHPTPMVRALDAITPPGT